MIRIVALMVCVLTSAVTIAFGQGRSHAQSHAPSQPHDPIGHPPMDPEQHAALHGLLDGKWLGPLSTPAGESRQMTISVTQTASGGDLFSVTAAPSLPFGAARQLAVQHHRIRWVQSVSGEDCKATADLVDGATPDRKILKGTLSCAPGDLTFSLTKTAK